MSMHELYPWQANIWERVTGQYDQNRFPHAMLFTGQSGLGKKQFAACLSEFILCEANGKQACGQCRSCQLCRSNSHPDLINVSPNDQSRAIKVDGVREVTHRVQQTALRGSYQVVIMNDVDTLNRAAANALLKTLEEPTDNVVFLLETSMPFQLPKTIVSRCQQIVFHLPSMQESISWLQSQHLTEDCELYLRLAQQSPLNALSLMQTDAMHIRSVIYTAFFEYHNNNISLIKAAEKINKAIDSLRDCVKWLLLLAGDLLMVSSGVTSSLSNQDYKMQINAFVEKQSVIHIPSILTEAARKLSTGIQVNSQLFIEALLYQCRTGNENYVS